MGVKISLHAENEFLDSLELDSQSNKNSAAPKELKKEMSALCKLGVEKYLVDYLLHIKAKQKASKKWKDELEMA